MFAKSFKYKLHLSNGSVILIKGVKNLRIARDPATGRLNEYNISYHNARDNKLFHVSPADIVAIEEV